MSRLFIRQSKLFWKLFLGYAVLTTLALGTCVLLILREYDEFYGEEIVESLRVQAQTLRSVVRGRLTPAHTHELDRIAKEAAKPGAHAVHITFVAADGAILGDSHADPADLDTHRDRIEIKAALDNGWGTATRWSNTAGRMMSYVALRVGPKEHPEGVVRVALGVATIGNRTQSVRKIIWTIAAIAITATALFSLGLARLWTMPIRRITAVAGRISRGDLTARARIHGSDELARLAESLNEMRRHLARQLTTIDHQRKTFEALLDQVQEGVIVAGPDGNVVHANPAAARLLHPDDAEHWVGLTWTGRPIEQCVPQHDLQRLLLADRITPSPPGDSFEEANAEPPGKRPETEIRIEIPNAASSLVLLARASTIRLPDPASDGRKTGDSSTSEVTGRILALTDISQIARTIQMKTDFVANASHELRTPLSAIRGAVETVLNIDVAEDAAAVKRFLGVIDRHSTRLEALVADLLALSRLEAPSSEFKPTTVDLRRFCDDLRDRWAHAIASKQLTWQCELASGLTRVTADVHLLGLAIDNLIDNAVKFTSPNGRITMTCNREDEALIIAVSDNGCGIPSQDHQRVFERFYQVAPDRSGGTSGQSEPRGTGLGLAIVRHAAAAMHGTVTLDSQVGVGTVVTLRIPQTVSAPQENDSQHEG